MRILITGANGFIGSHLVRHLSQKKENKIFCLVRPDSDLKNLKGLTMKIIRGDITKMATLKKIPVVEEVFHLAGKLGQWGTTDKAYWDLHLQGTKNLVRVLDKRKLKRFFFFSSPSVAGPNIDNLVWKESDNYAPSNIYELTKAEAEKFLLSQNLPLTIIRPEFVYGPGDRHIFQLIKAIKKHRFFIIGSGKNLLQPTYIKDVIAATILIRKSPQTINQIYHIAGREKISLEELAKTIAEILRVKISLIKIPKFFAYAMALPLEKLSEVFKFNPILNSQRIKFFTKSHIFDTSKIERDLNFYPQYSIKEGFVQTINWYKNHGWL